MVTLKAVYEMNLQGKYNMEIMNKIFELVFHGVYFSQNFLRECQFHDLSRDFTRRFSISSTLSFVEKLLESSLCYYIKVENEADVLAFLDGKTIAFEVKSLYPFAAKYFRSILDWTRWFYDAVLNKYGLFAKVMFLPSQKHFLKPYIIDYRKVPTTYEASFGVLYFSLDALNQWVLRRIKSRLSRCYSQLLKFDTKYKVAVIDMRYEGVNEVQAYKYILNVLKYKDYRELSGVILITFDVESKQNICGTKLILISNPNAENPIDGSHLFKKPKYSISHTKKYLLVLPTRIRLNKTGWQDLIQIGPEYKIAYKRVKYGSL